MPRTSRPLTLDQKLAQGLITQEYYEKKKEAARKLGESAGDYKDTETIEREQNEAKMAKAKEKEASFENFLRKRREKKEAEMRSGKLATFKMESDDEGF